jgi:putative transposase
MTGISKSQVSRLCGEIDERVNTFLNRPLEGEWPYLWLDATYVKVRQAGRIVSVAVIIAVGVNDDGRREVLGMTVGASEAETFWTEFLRSLPSSGHSTGYAGGTLGQPRPTRPARRQAGHL